MQSTVQNHLGCDDHERFTNLVFLNPWLGFLSNKTTQLTGLKMSLKKWKKIMQIVPKCMHLRIRAFMQFWVKNQENKITI